MKNQYFGDVNDYRKYGLLRALQSTGDAKLLVAWMLTPDDGGTDGRRRDYLRDPGKWERYDPKLYTELTSILRSASAPRVSLIEATDLLPRASYYVEIVPDGRKARDHWREALLAVASQADLVFLDPDNGIEIPSKPVGRKDSSKYVTWREIQELWNAGCSLLVYQHYPHEPRDAFADRMTSELRRSIGAPFVEAFRTANVLFLLAAQERHAELIRRAISHSVSRWAGEIDVVGFSEARSLSGAVGENAGVTHVGTQYAYKQHKKRTLDTQSYTSYDVLSNRGERSTDVTTPPQLAQLFNELTRAMQRLNIDLLERKQYTRAQEATRLLEQLERLEEQARALERGDDLREARPSPSASAGGQGLPVDEFPKYERVDESLVKTGLRRDKQDTYEQRMPSDEVAEVLTAIAELATTKKRFSAKAVKDRVDLADYKIYLVLGLLDHLGWVSTPQRGTYTVAANIFQESAHPLHEIWSALPEGGSR